MKYRHLRFPGGVGKVLTFSYDDGHIVDKKLADIFTSYGVKATFNICSSYVGEGRLTKEDIKEHILDKGHEVANHGFEHTAPGMLRPFEGIQEYLNCRMGLEEMFGIPVRGLAYPNAGIRRMANGANYENIRRYIADTGIVYARSLGADNDEFSFPTDWFNWIPTMHHDNVNSLVWAQKFADANVSTGGNARRYPLMCYIWGHAFEFDRKDNWEHIHDLLRILANRDDTWYATNIEIYEYIEAYDRLVFTADSKKVYNPTLKDIWFEQDEKLFCIRSGETVVLE